MWPFNKKQNSLEAIQADNGQRIRIRENRGTVNINPVTTTGLSDRQFSIINHKLDLIMSKQDKVDIAIERLTNSAANISADLNNLKQQIADGTVSEESVTKLEALANSFQAIADSTEDAPAEGAGNGEAPAEGAEGSGEQA